MKNITLRLFLSFLVAAVCGASQAAEQPSSQDKPQLVDLTPRLASGDVAQVTAKLEVGGEVLVVDDKGAEISLPMSVVGDLDYAEQLVLWSADAEDRVVALRRYDHARATLKAGEAGDSGVDRTLPDDRRDLTAVVVGDQRPINTASGGGPLTREQFDLVDIPANTLVLDRLLPGRELAIGDNWDHEPAVIGALLGLDHVGACEVRSAVLGVERDQVQIRLTGTVNGTVEGAATELDVRAAYLFHLKHGRITKFNLAVQEKRKAGEIGPGLDVTAKLTLVVKPLDANAAPFDAQAVAAAAEVDPGQLAQLAFDDSTRGFKFRHSQEWFVTGEQPHVLSLRLLRGGELLAHCNVSTLPSRGEKNAASLAEFETDVKEALGENISSIAAAEEWTTPAGARCLAIFANGAVKEVPMQWRYYLLSTADRPLASVSVTVESGKLESFDNADRGLIDSLELLAPAATAAKPQAVK